MSKPWTEFLVTNNSEYHWNVADEDAIRIVVSYHEREDDKLVMKDVVRFPIELAPEIAKRISEAARLAEKARLPE